MKVADSKQKKKTEKDLLKKALFFCLLSEFILFQKLFTYSFSENESLKPSAQERPLDN